MMCSRSSCCRPLKSEEERREEARGTERGRRGGGSLTCVRERGVFAPPLPARNSVCSGAPMAAENRKNGQVYLESG